MVRRDQNRAGLLQEHQGVAHTREKKPKTVPKQFQHFEKEFEQLGAAKRAQRSAKSVANNYPNTRAASDVDKGRKSQRNLRRKSRRDFRNSVWRVDRGAYCCREVVKCQGSKMSRRKRKNRAENAENGTVGDRGSSQAKEPRTEEIHARKVSTSERGNRETERMQGWERISRGAKALIPHVRVEGSERQRE